MPHQNKIKDTLMRNNEKTEFEEVACIYAAKYITTLTQIDLLNEFPINHKNLDIDKLTPKQREMAIKLAEKNHYTPLQ